MRLTVEEADAIRRAARRAFGETAVVRLFGSRADATRRGGDIDLHVEVDDDAADTWRAKSDFERYLFAMIEEQKVDVVTHRTGSEARAIDVIAHQRGIVL